MSQVVVPGDMTQRNTIGGPSAGWGAITSMTLGDVVGRLRPSGRSASGHRLYDAGDVARLQKIVSLRRLGFSLAQIQTIKEMTMMDKYYTSEQQAYLKHRAEQIGPERIRQGSQDWAELIAQVRAEMEKGTDPATPQVQALAKRWMDLVAEFTGDDRGIEQSLNRLWTEQGDELSAQHGSEYDPRAVSEYIGKAMAARDKS